VDTWLNSNGFTNVGPNLYWSSTREPGTVSNGLVLNLGTYYTTIIAVTSTGPLSWPVRGGE